MALNQNINILMKILISRVMNNKYMKEKHKTDKIVNTKTNNFAILTKLQNQPTFKMFQQHHFFINLFHI